MRCDMCDDRDVSKIPRQPRGESCCCPDAEKVMGQRNLEEVTTGWDSQFEWELAG